MTPYQIASLILAFLLILGGIIGVYTNMQMKIAKINAEILEIRNLIATNTSNIEQIRKENREDHRLMFNKLEEINTKL